jgi:hypothetical protein
LRSLGSVSDQLLAFSSQQLARIKQRPVGRFLLFVNHQGWMDEFPKFWALVKMTDVGRA